MVVHQRIGDLPSGWGDSSNRIASTIELPAIWMIHPTLFVYIGFPAWKIYFIRRHMDMSDLTVKKSDDSEVLKIDASGNLGGPSPSSLLTVQKGNLLTVKASDMTLASTVTFASHGKEVARISPDGILRFTVEASDENALRFIECMERVFVSRLTGLDVVKS